ncbi:MAG: hypothetical protein IT378_27430 [Sandaracinaceae bacterium]|nr:hypothetical protein [Sandaracinaceae bacterium]
MKKLPVGRGRYARDLDQIITGTRLKDRAAALQGAKGVAVRQASAYRRSPPSKRALQQGVTAEQRKAFLDCWEQRPAAVEAIRARVFRALPSHHQGRCPYCALPPNPTDLDHFREKSLVPELALYDRNLVPSHPDCNTSRDDTFDAEGRQCVLHFYDDAIDEVPDVLVARVEAEDSCPVARFSVADDPSPLARLYARHFTALKLADRYCLWAATAMREVVQDTRLAAEQSAKWPEILVAVANDHHATWGSNEPKAALLRAMAERPDVLARLVGT